jgi:hypothetical protein
MLVLRSDPELPQMVVEVLGSEPGPQRARHRSEQWMFRPIALIDAGAE